MINLEKGGMSFRLLKYTDILISDIKYLNSLLYAFGKSIPKGYYITENLFYSVKDDAIFVSYKKELAFCILYKKTASNIVLTVKHGPHTTLKIHHNGDTNTIMPGNISVMGFYLDIICKLIDHTKYMINQIDLNTEIDVSSLFEEIQYDLNNYTFKVLDPKEEII